MGIDGVTDSNFAQDFNRSGSILLFVGSLKGSVEEAVQAFEKEAKKLPVSEREQYKARINACAQVIFASIDAMMQAGESREKIRATINQAIAGLGTCQPKSTKERGCSKITPVDYEMTNFKNDAPNRTPLKPAPKHSGSLFSYVMNAEVSNRSTAFFEIDGAPMTEAVSGLHPVPQLTLQESYNIALMLPGQHQIQLDSIVAKSRKLPSKHESRNNTKTEYSLPKNIGDYLFMSSTCFQSVLCSRSVVRQESISNKVSIYVTQGADGTLGYVKKTDSLDKIMSEVKAISTFNEVNLTYSSVPNVLGIESTTEGTATLFTTRLPGLPISHYIKEMNETSDELRQKKFAKTETAIIVFGKALGELHSQKRTIDFPLDYFVTERVFFRDNYDIVEEYAKKNHITLPHKLEDIEKAFNAFSEAPGALSLVHEDPHVNNVIFDESKGKVGLVDLSAKSISSKGIVEAHPLDYYHRSVHSLRRTFMRYDLTWEEQKALLAAFRNSYEFTYAGKIPKASDEFYRMDALYMNVADYILQVEEFEADSPNEAAFHHNIIRRLLENK